MDDSSGEITGGFDLHGHTKVKHPKFQYRPPIETQNYSATEAIQRAKDIGLDGIAISDHDTLEAIDEALNAAAKHGLIVVPGVEITTRNERRFPHILALGLTPDSLGPDKIPSFGKTRDVIKWIQDHGGVAIGAHPQPELNFTSLLSLTNEQVAHLAHLLDGVEVISPGIPESNRPRLQTLASELNLPQLASSDFHDLGKIGVVRTQILRTCHSWEDVITAIRSGQVQPFLNTDISFVPFEDAWIKQIHNLIRPVQSVAGIISSRDTTPKKNRPEIAFSTYLDPEGKSYPLPQDLRLKLPDRARSLPPEDRHLLIEIPWENDMLRRVPKEYRAMFKDALPDLGVRTTDVHVATCFKYLHPLLAEHQRLTGQQLNERVIAAALVYHDTGWSRLSDQEVALSLGYQGVKLPESAIAPKEKHALESEDIARQKLAVRTQKFLPPLSDAEVDLVCQAVRWHDKPEAVAQKGQIPEEVRTFVDLDHLWSLTHENFWQDCVRKGVSASQYLQNLRRESTDYFVTPAGKNLAARLLAERQKEVDQLPTPPSSTWLPL